MARGDVADLVTQHGGQLGLGVQIGEDAAGDIDIPAGQREGVDLRGIHHQKLVLQTGAVTGLGQALADVVDIALQDGIVISAVLRAYFLVFAAPGADFL